MSHILQKNKKRIAFIAVVLCIAAIVYEYALFQDRRAKKINYIKQQLDYLESSIPTIQQSRLTITPQQLLVEMRIPKTVEGQFELRIDIISADRMKTALKTIDEIIEIKYDVQDFAFEIPIEDLLAIYHSKLDDYIFEYPKTEIPIQDYISAEIRLYPYDIGDFSPEMIEKWSVRPKFSFAVLKADLMCGQKSCRFIPIKP